MPMIATMIDAATVQIDDTETVTTVYKLADLLQQQSSLQDRLIGVTNAINAQLAQVQTLITMANAVGVTGTAKGAL
jgi:predicted kinase